MTESNKARAAAGRTGAGGFTLVELLVALSILLIFGLMAATALSYGSRLWRSAHRRSYAYDVASAVFQQFDDDLSAARSQFWGKEENAFDTRIKLWADHDALFAGAAGDQVGGRQRLRFVRGIPDATVNPRIRQAGDGVDNDGDAPAVDEEYYNLQDDDGDDRVDEDLMPLEGMCEVAYQLGIDNQDPGLPAYDANTLYRAVLAPIGRTPAALGDPDHTFFDPDIFGATASGYGAAASGRIVDKSVVVGEGVIHFEVRLWTQYTTTWELRDEDDEPLEFTPWENSYEPEVCPPVLTWDSDRLADTAPDFPMDPGQPGFDHDTADHDDDGTENEEDEDYVRDNVFPRSVMVVLVVDPSEEYPARVPLELRADLDVGDDTVYVRGNLPAHNEAWPYIYLDDEEGGDDEWIRFESYTPDDAGGYFTVAPDGRGARGTAEVLHPAGRPVKFGYTFSRVFHDPTSREYWGQ